MKKIISILLTLAMLAAMIPAAVVSVSAANSGKWTDAGNYDLSWMPEANAAGANTVTIGDKNYQVKGYTTETAFEIKDAADLAGLAVLSNTAETSDGTTHKSTDNFGTDAWFLNCVFYITGDIELAGLDWEPIANCFDYRFGGSLIGSKGAADGTGTQITISNMTINSTHTDTAHAVGFIGTICGGDIENIKLENATVTAKNFRVGSFAGQANELTLKDLESDAVITVSNPLGNNAWDVAGGIAGCTYGNNVSVENCIFTGTIDNGVSNANGDVSGGILGLSQNTCIIQNCIVDSDFIKVTVGNDGSNYGCGGVVGILRNGNTSSNVFSITNCYVNAEIAGLKNRTGGIVGAIWEDNSAIVIENCQFDGAVLSNTSQVGAFVGYADKAEVQLNSCLNTGIAINATATNNVTTLGFKGIAGYSTKAPVVTNAYSAYPLTDITTSSVSALDTTADTWTARSGKYPILDIAKNYENAPEEAELSWFNPANTTDTVAIDSYNDLLGLSLITKACGTNAETFLGTYKLEISRVLADYITTDLFTESVAATLSEMLTGELNSESVTAVYAQTSTAVSDGKYNVRIIAEIKGKEWASAGFAFMVSYKDTSGNVIASDIADVTVDTCYTSLLATTADGKTAITAEEGHYFVVFVLSGIDASNAVTISAVASVTNAQSETVCGAAASFSFDIDGKPVLSVQ